MADLFFSPLSPELHVPITLAAIAIGAFKGAIEAWLEHRREQRARA
jgi:hypothetical protein